MWEHSFAYCANCNDSQNRNFAKGFIQQNFSVGTKNHEKFLYAIVVLENIDCCARIWLQKKFCSTFLLLSGSMLFIRGGNWLGAVSS